MKLIKSFFHSRSRWAEVLRYASGCGCGILLKLLLTTLLTWCGISFFYSYLICHAVVLVESFCFHYLITFRRRFESFPALLRDVGKYISMVFVIKLMDFLLVVLLDGYIKEYLVERQFSATAVMLCNNAVIVLVSVLIFVLRYFLYQVVFRKLDCEYYTGSVRSAQIVHACDKEIAGNAASGGAVTALLIDLLEHNEIDGALVARMDWSQPQRPLANGFIARTREELIAAQGSIYFDFPLLSKQIMQEIRQFDGRLAVVALPCQTAALRKICAQDPTVNARIKLIIGLFCGHATSRELLGKVLAKGNVNINDVTDYRFRRGPWQGYSQTFLRSGEVITRPTAFYDLYQNLYIHCAQRCWNCTDHFAENADISCGDIWMLKYRKSPVKPSMTAVRSIIGETVMHQAVEHGAITAETVSTEVLFKANSRSAIFHKAIAARRKVMAAYGVEIKVPENAAPARCNELLAAWIIAKLTARDPDKVLRMSRRILKIYLYVFKALTSF